MHIELQHCINKLAATVNASKVFIDIHIIKSLIISGEMGDKICLPNWEFMFRYFVKWQFRHADKSNRVQLLRE